MKKHQQLKSTSLEFPECQDSVRFIYEDNTLNITTRQTNQERLSFSISEEKHEIINDISHLVLISNKGDTFYIVNNQFHREGDKPAITMRRLSPNSGYFYNDRYELVWSKLWIKNGLYHQKNRKRKPLDSSMGRNFSSNIKKMQSSC